MLRGAGQSVGPGHLGLHPGGPGVSWPCGVASGGLQPIGADQCLERELSRAWSRRDFQDALAASNPGIRHVALTLSWRGQRILEPLTDHVEGHRLPIRYGRARMIWPNPAAITLPRRSKSLTAFRRSGL